MIKSQTASLREKIEAKEKDLQLRMGVFNMLKEKQKKIREEESKNHQLANKSANALSFVENSVHRIRNKTLRSIESVTNEALASVYGNNIKIECDFGIKRDRSAVQIFIVKILEDGRRVKIRPEGSGCGVSDVIALSLRMVLIRATASELVLICDEPFKWIDRNKIEKMALLLKYLSQKMNIQIISASHHPAMRDLSDVAYRIALEEDVAKVTLTN